MTGEYTNEFVGSLPRGPLVQHIGQVHAILMHTGAGREPNALNIAEHSLRQMAIYTAQAERYPGSFSAVAKPPLSDFAKVMRKALSNMEGVLNRYRAKQPLDALNESVSIRRYKAAVESERIAGLAHVKQEGRRVRKELGLPSTPTKRSK